MFEKVLVCLDSSPESEEVLPYIYQEATHFSKVVFMTVLYPPVVQVPVSVPGGAVGAVHTNTLLKEFKKALDEAPGYLEEKAAPLRQKGVTVETIVLQGVPTVMITDYIRFNDVTLLAIATHGHSGFRELTLGSTAEYLIHNAGIPIMLVTPRKRGKGVK